MWTVWTGTGTDCFGLKLAHAEAIESHYTSVQSTSSYTNNAYLRTFLKQTKWYLRAIFKRVKKLIRDGIVFVIGLKLSPSSRPIKFKN